MGYKTDYKTECKADIKTDYNIEFAHFYADKELSKEQVKSVSILNEFIKKLELEGKTYVVSVLVDDFHPTIFRLDKQRIVEELNKLGVSIDFIGFESKLGVVGDQLIQDIPKPLLKLEHFNNPRKEVLMLEKDKEEISLEEEFKFMYRHTCALLSAAWSLCRLGVYNIPEDAVLSLGNKAFAAKKTMTILPEQYKHVEDKVLDIISATKYGAAAKDVGYTFFKV
ncbi:MAG: hypothetical protein V1866_00725 [archaeon]